MTDEQLWLVSCTIQQLLVEHALYLTGPMTMERIQHAEDILQYYPPTSHLNLTITNFVGFNVRQLHENLLKFHYHKNGGILHANEGFFNHARALLTKLDNSLFPWDDASTLSWIRWLRHVRLPQSKTARIHPEILDSSLNWSEELFNQHA
jgi:hypothetical protein